MMKLFLQKCLLLCLFSVGGISCFADRVTINGVVYKWNQYDSYAMVDFNDRNKNASGDIVILSQVPFNGQMRKVEMIVGEAFKDCKGITSVTIQEGVSIIGARAFEGCNNLKKIQLPSSVKEICESAFHGSSIPNPIIVNDLFAYCPATFTGSYAIPEGIRTICGGAFHDCSNLTAITIPPTVTVIGVSAFWNCRNLTTISIPSTVREIGDHAFAFCLNLTTIGIPSSVVEIGDDILLACSKLTEPVYHNNMLVRLPESHQGNYTIKEGTTKIHSHAFSDCYHLTSVIIPKSVTAIGKYAFNQCKSLASVELPNSIKKIEKCTFRGCKNLTKVNIPNTISEIENRAFVDCSNLKYVLITNPNCKIDENKIGNVVVARNYEDCLKASGGYSSLQEISNNTNKYFIVSRDNCFGLINYEGKLIIPCEMEAIESAGPGYLRYKINGFWGLMNYQAKVIIDTDRGYTSIGDFKSFNKRFSYTMSGYKGECDETGKQLSKIKVEASEVPNTSNTSSKASSTNSNTQSNTTTQQTIVVEHHRDPQPMQEWQQCVACYGSGQCPSVDCGGSGWYYIGDKARTCWRCHGSGKCDMCAGNGGHYITVYR